VIAVMMIAIVIEIVFVIVMIQQLLWTTTLMMISRGQLMSVRRDNDLVSQEVLACRS